jgi:hypothetical protein
LTGLVSNAVATRVKFEGLILRINLNYHFKLRRMSGVRELLTRTPISPTTSCASG